MKYVVLFAGHLYKPFRTIWVDRVGRGGQGRSKSAPEWPEFGFGAVQRPPNWSMNPEMDPNGSPNCPWLIWVHFLTVWSIAAIIYQKNINYLILWKVWISEMLTFTASTDQMFHFFGNFLIILSLPPVGWLGKIEISWKKCIVWSVEAVKVTCIFYRILG